MLLRRSLAPITLVATLALLAGACTAKDGPRPPAAPTPSTWG